MNLEQVTLKDILGKSGLFDDGDWVESKDQDPNGGVRLIQLADVGDGEYINKSARFLTSEKAKELKCTFLKKGDLLISRMPDPLGKACLFPGDLKPCVTVVDVSIVRPDPQLVDNNWLKYCVNSFEFRTEISKYISGTTRQRISRGNLSKIKFSLPPLPEQRRIAAILDKADALRRKRAETLKFLDDFLRSVFLEMFGDPVKNEKGWEIKSLDEVTTRITDGVHQKPNYTATGVPFISVKNITNGFLDFESCKFISESDHERFTKRCKPEYNDILYTKVGATYGRPAIVDTDREFSIYVSVALIKPDHKKINPIFLKEVLANPAIKNQADQSIKGVGVPDLHLVEIKKFLIPCPPKNIQKKFVDLTNEIKKQRENITDSGVLNESLFNALTQRAFRGEL